MAGHDLRVVKTKQALHAALLTLLGKKPLENISITEICREAKVNRGTFYLHYEQKEKLFEEYFKEIMMDLEQSYEEPYRAVNKFNKSLLDAKTVRIFHHIENYKMFYRIVFSKNVPLTYYYMLYEEIHKLLKRDMAHNEIGEISVDYISAYHANALIGMIIEWYNNDFTESASFLNEQLVAILKLDDHG